MSTPAAPSIVRTVVPLAVGQVIAYVATLGIDVPKDVEAGLTVLLGFVATSVYYIAIRFIEQKFPWVGGLLGWASTPDGYSPGNEVEADIPADELVNDEIGEPDFEDIDGEDEEELDPDQEQIADDQAKLDEGLTESDETPVPDGYDPQH